MIGRYTVYHRVRGMWQKLEHTYSKSSEAYKAGYEVTLDNEQRFAIRGSISGSIFVYNASGKLIGIVHEQK